MTERRMMRAVQSKIVLRAAASCALLCAVAVASSAQTGGDISGFAEVNGTRLHYESRGRGPAVVLLHGGLVDSRLWDEQMKPLSKRFRVVRYDLRGYGRSAEPSESFSHLEDLRG